MLDALYFVKGAVARKNIVPALSHFRIAAGKIKSFNGSIALCAPIPLELNVQPKAVPLIKAIESCSGSAALHVTPTGRLSIKSGKFKAFVECDPSDNFPDIEPEGERIPLTNGGLLKMFKQLEPLIGEDMSRAWSRGILLRDDFAFATNNIILVQYWLGYKFPCELVIPHEAVNELLRIGEEPEAMSVTSSNVTFHFANGRWLRTQTFSTQWPDVNRVLNVEVAPTFNAIESEFFDEVAKLKPFVDELNRLFLLGDRLTTSFVADQGAAVEFAGLPPRAVLNIHQVLLLKGIAEKFDFRYLPDQKLMFFGPGLRGAMSPMRFEWPQEG